MGIISIFQDKQVPPKMRKT